MSEIPTIIKSLIFLVDLTSLLFLFVLLFYPTMIGREFNAVVLNVFIINVLALSYLVFRLFSFKNISKQNRINWIFFLTFINVPFLKSYYAFRKDDEFLQSEEENFK
ncbi:hypothetical protein MWN41_12160, partial [Ornithobacterium rhinotracheale]|uniref:hypothetical protein n=1 Tax=Ornithobacterium rhinotracheale TaxID=28251 RepID=UPI001FF40A83